MAAGITDTLSRVTDSTTGRPVIALLANPGKAIGANSININDATNWTTQSAIHFSIFETITVAGVTIKDTSTQTDWKGVLAGTTITNLTITGGADRAYTAGALVELTPTSRYAKDLYDNISAHANQDGSLKSAAVQAALNLGSGALNGWNPLAFTPNSITYNGNRSYDLVFNGQDITGAVSNGMRLRTTRTVAAPTQCASLNGTSQYFSKSSPAGMSFTDDFTISAWVKLSSYPTTSAPIISRYNGTSGWKMNIELGGQVTIAGFNGSAANYRGFQSYQSIPLNRWVHITGQLDMSTYTATPTTCYIMIDGVDVPGTTIQGGTNPTSLAQAGDLQVGSLNTAFFFPGKIAQVAVFNAKVAQATMRGYLSQGLSGSEASLISAYSFNNSITDLNTTNANNLTAQNAASATNADSPFTQDDTGTPGGSFDFGIITRKSFSTNTTLTVQVPEGCTIPTTGGVSAAAYATEQVPYGFPSSRGKWSILTHIKLNINTPTPATTTWYSGVPGGYAMGISIPVGSWQVSYAAAFQMSRGTVADLYGGVTLSASSTTSTDPELDSSIASNGTLLRTLLSKSKVITVSSATLYYLIYQTQTAALSNLYVVGSDSTIVIAADNAYL